MILSGAWLGLISLCTLSNIIRCLVHMIEYGQFASCESMRLSSWSFIASGNGQNDQSYKSESSNHMNSAGISKKKLKKLDFPSERKSTSSSCSTSLF
jgi:hypothetical protein